MKNTVFSKEVHGHKITVENDSSGLAVLLDGKDVFTLVISCGLDKVPHFHGLIDSPYSNEIVAMVHYHENSGVEIAANSSVMKYRYTESGFSPAHILKEIQ